ncbi:hypothetical protein [Erythrobacter tepidarius]|uniref:hypothetical protein n=1 Tax=Erythrobacter tepidarius TaxID=60454 RepID=UPI000A37910F|nr:hypothetical protein [Erythrobacter tepidarius]
MPTARLAAMLMLCAVLALPACKPAPADVGSAQAANLPLLPRPSQPIDSPDTANAVWVASGGPLRLVYGVPGEPVLLALQCEGAGTPEAQLRITRHAPADRGAGALLALIGNGRIGRFPVDATRVRGQLVWQGAVPAARPEWEALTPLREATVTVPGAGLVKLNPSPLPMQLVEACRGQPETPVPASPAAPA